MKCPSVSVSLTESVVLSFFGNFDTTDKSTNASYCRPHIEQRRVRALKILRNGTYSTQVLLKAKGDSKLQLISFLFVTTYSNTITNTDSDDCCPYRISTVHPCNQNSTTILNSVLNHISKKLQFLYQLLS